MHDLRYALRGLCRTPGFTAVSILTLALGIGAVTIIYSIVHNVVLDPLPYRDAGRLVNVFVQDGQTGRVRGTFSGAEILDFRERSSVFEGVIATLGQGVRYETADSVEYLRGVWVTPNFFDFMGLAPLHGRTFGPDDGRPDAPAVAVLRHRAWVTFFGGDPSVVGRTVVLDGAPRTIIGVMPPRFTWHAADLWMPAPLDRQVTGAAPPLRNFQARLKPHATLQEAEAQLQTIAASRAREHPKDYPEKLRMQVVNVIEYTVGQFSGVLYTTLAAVAVLLLIACCNVANMLLARGTTREREMMLRMALGAGRGRIVSQLMVESLLLAAGGVVFGCLLAYLGIDAIVARLPQNPLPGEVDIVLNTPVLLFSLSIASLSAVVFGMAPALYTARRDLVCGSFKSGGRVAGRRGRLRHGLVAAEIALALVLVTSAGLLMRSFISVTRTDLGFNPQALLFTGVAFPPGRYTTASERQRFYEQSLERIASLPGVQRAAVTTALPPFDAGPEVGLEVLGMPARDDWRSVVQPVTAAYFSTLGLQLTRGTAFKDLVVDETARVAIVNQAFVDRYGAGHELTGRQIRLTPLTGPPDPARPGFLEIVGVVSDVRNQGLGRPSQPQVYVPWVSSPRANPLILVRTAGDPIASIRAVRRELAMVDRQVAVVQARTLPDLLDRVFYAQPRFSLLVLGIFAVTGTLLVGVGVFSVMAYTVSVQRKEIAVRVALGASRAQSYRAILRLGAQLLAAGAGVGLVASFATNRLVASQLSNISPHDPLTLAVGTLLVSLIALAACYIPARRASLVEPIAALRDE